MDLKTPRYEITDRIAVITLARPRRRNAWTGRMHTDYRWLLSQADQDQRPGWKSGRPIGGEGWVAPGRV